MSDVDHTSRDLGDGMRLVHYHYPAHDGQPDRFALICDRGAAWATVWLTRDQILAMTAVVANAVPLA